MNRGFMRGPFLPIYGSGAIVMLVASMPFQDNLVLVYLAGCVGATALEYVTGVAMEALFKVRYWDYSKKRFNFQGHICLSSTLAWGGLTILMTEVIHRPIERFVLSIPHQVLTVVTLVLTAGIFSDFALSFKAAMDLRDILVRMEKVKTEMVHIQKRLDVLIALTNEELSNIREEYNEKSAQWREEWSESLSSRMEDMKLGVEERLESIKEPLNRLWEESGQSARVEGMRQEWDSLRARYSKLVMNRENLGRVKDWFQKNMLRSNPTMYSVRFGEALEELKRQVSERLEQSEEKEEDREQEL